ncbi:purine nucleoside phosphorylase, putative [Entamoeba dispar SAW760]|uniref:Purine nucleoside phosphorylase, putative n=1 Tax=Entamoeba dispar (strain ATCC PRA-260 / SAW760) TaxID=370354 RepID=B0ERN1_ENTDS|nr:purine nucleoside phosphorylase, putative [Entamoeba dispar SAW760]EDR22835.1 purine nucleoside phosphorylase, putative [Entamoeba dispar SAW760]|eukprot:EDR22835.1 purine nucleoside phosphorylase, putative [Entamoeba dispar SAW760]
MSRLTEATLPANGNTIYHLSITAEDLADNIILVGDPERVPKASKLLFDESKPIFRRDHRGLTTMTGFTPKGLRISIVTHGMGTGSAEIIINEILALKCIDVKTRTPKAAPTHPVNIIRVGTSGAISKNTPIGTAIVTKYTVGLDNTGLFYDVKQVNKEALELEKEVTEKIDKAIPEGHRFKGKIRPYVSVPNPLVVEALEKVAKEQNVSYKVGITASAAGFFVCQGRFIFKELPTTISSLEEVLMSVKTNDLMVENFEMEMSCITQITQGFKWVRSGGICEIVDNRQLKTFTSAEDVSVDKILKVAADALAILDTIPIEQ